MLARTISLLILLSPLSCVNGAPLSRQASLEERAISGLVSRFGFFAAHPEKLSVHAIETAFPGVYKVYQCNPQQTFCGRENQNQRQALRLNTYFVNTDSSHAALGGTLSAFIPKSTYCLPKARLEELLGKAAERPNPPLPIEQFPGSKHKSDYVEFKGLNAAHPQIVIGASLQDDCVIEMTLDAILKQDHIA